MRFHLVRMWEVEGREILERGDVHLFPFVPLSRCGREEILEAEERIHESEIERGEKSDLLTALAIFSGLKSEDIMRELFRRRRDIMIESPAYELIKREGFEEGMERGIGIGVESGKLEDAKEMVLEALEERFGIVPLRIAETIRKINERAVLRGILRRAIRCSSLQEFEEILREVIREG